MTTQQMVIEAEASLKEAKAAHARQLREEWKQKARDIAREARVAKSAFLKAKARYAECSAELDRLDVKRRQIGVDLDALGENFQALEIPLPEEEEAYASEKQKLDARIAKLRLEVGQVQARRGQAWQDEISCGQQYSSLAHAYSNAKALAAGRPLGVIEGGTAVVE